MTDQLTIPGAVDSPLVVQLATLTVQGRKLSRNLYSQLRAEPVIGADGTLNGKPWGYANQHDGRDCGQCRWRTRSGHIQTDVDAGHKHVIWQRDDELLRCLVFSPYVDEHRMRFVDREIVRAWDQLSPETWAARRRSLNLIAGLPQIFIGR